MGQCESCLRNFFYPFGRSSRSRISRPELITIDPLALNVREVDLLIDRNTLKHHTNQFEITTRPFDPALVVRRGSPFEIKVLFQREARSSDDVVNLVFRVRDASSPKYSQGTEIILPLSDENFNEISPRLSGKSKQWDVAIVRWEARSLILEINPAVDCIVGEWTLTIETRSRTSGNRRYSSHTVRRRIFILFNPWNRDDPTYLRDPRKRDEYVLNDNGIIWKGTSNRLRRSPWSFAQFEENVLECCVRLLSRVGKLSVTDRSDPVKVARHLSQIVHTANGEGVVVGNWSGKYRGGKDPSEWAGSQIILQKFYKTGRPVKYGQCWVFSGVLTTVCRCLGIPARPVTNYESAHDTHNSLTVDRILSEDGELVEPGKGDSVWNFHSWTEIWIKRPDLSVTGVYDGWQVIDATPQEPSDGLYRCGPTSVNAVRNGEVLREFDGKFVFAEVNADEVFWLKRGDREPVKFLGSDTAIIGQNISTKEIGSNERRDLTVNYKYKESSPEERETMLKALLQCNSIFSRYYLNDEFNDVRFEILLIDDVLIGKPFNVRLKVYNKSNQVYTIIATIRVHTTLYTGHIHALVKKDIKELRISPSSDSELKSEISYDDYGDHLIDQSSFSVMVVAKVLENDFHYSARDDFRVRMPDIEIQVEGDVFEGRPFRCHAFFKNPLPKKLTKGIFLVEGPGLGSPLKIPLKESVKLDEEARVTFILTPKTEGEKTINVRFTSKELKDVDGYRKVRVSKFMDFVSLENLDRNFRRSPNNTLDD